MFLKLCTENGRRGGGVIKETANSPKWIWGIKKHSESLYATEAGLSAGGGCVNSMISASLPPVLNMLTKQQRQQQQQNKNRNNFISSRIPLHQNVPFQGAVQWHYE